MNSQADMSHSILPVILCGGSGSRLWPLSREQFPKQLLKLQGDHTMLQVTAMRLGAAFPGVLAPLLVGNEDYRFMLADQVKQAGIVGAKLLLEPIGRNTAPALTLAALASQCMVPGQTVADPILVIMPADHVIQDEQAFRVAVQSATRLAQAGKLVTFGIQPDAPETGYGYIKQGAIISEGAYQVVEFVEKPDFSTAQTYLASGNYLWNAGIFVVKASVWLAKVTGCRPDIASACVEAFENRVEDANFIRPDRDAFAACPSDSIDYAVMERLANAGHNSGEVMVVPLAAQWSDVGAWNALWDIGDKDADANVLSGDVLTIDSHNTLVLAQSRLVACVGLDNAVIVETQDAVLVSHRDHIQQVKDVVNKLKAQGRPEAGVHRKVFRPWGWYDSVDEGRRFQVKRIVVNPGASLSLQMHHHRAEHWIVVQGTARVTCDDKVFLLAENQSTYIPLGATHRLENPGQLPLEIIEVQSGSYLGEDDIVRFEDKYGR
jgi:mannose-1-phosphate guanylyltransferase/mannose-6-phosphate isomerase